MLAKGRHCHKIWNVSHTISCFTVSIGSYYFLIPFQLVATAKYVQLMATREVQKLKIDLNIYYNKKNMVQYWIFASSSIFSPVSLQIQTKRSKKWLYLEMMPMICKFISNTTRQSKNYRTIFYSFAFLLLLLLQLLVHFSIGLQFLFWLNPI